MYVMFQKKPTLLNAITIENIGKIRELVEVEEITNGHIQEACKSERREILDILMKKIRKD